MTDPYNPIAALFAGIDTAPGSDSPQAEAESAPAPAPDDVLQTKTEPAVVPEPELPQPEAEVPVAVPDSPAAETEPPAAPIDPVFDIATIEVEHARWLVSEGKEGKRANFRGLDLSGVDMSGRHFVEASLRGTVLLGANLSGTDLRTADLAEAVLDGANLSGALLSGASLARAQLHQVQASGVDLTTANLTAAIAEGISLSGAKLGGAILRDANFRHADFTHALLRDANLRGATLVEANLSAADLSAADCRDVNFDRAIFAGALLAKTNFRGAKLGGIDFLAADFSVALDVATEFQAQSLQSDRARLQEEQEQLAAREYTLVQERERVNTRYALVTSMAYEQGRIALRLGKLSRGFIFRFVLWLLIAALVLMLTAMRAEEIDIIRMTGVMAGVSVVLLLAIFSMLRSIQVAFLIKKIVAAQPPELEKMKEEPSAAAAGPVLFSPPTPAKTTADDKTAGVSLAKKK